MLPNFDSVGPAGRSRDRKANWFGAMYRRIEALTRVIFGIFYGQIGRWIIIKSDTQGASGEDWRRDQRRMGAGWSERCQGDRDRCKQEGRQSRRTDNRGDARQASNSFGAVICMPAGAELVVAVKTGGRQRVSPLGENEAGGGKNGQWGRGMNH